MLARKLSSPGSRRWPIPCLARNTTRCPLSVANTKGADGLPNGVETSRSSRSVSSAMSYRPLPPMMPIRGAEDIDRQDPTRSSARHGINPRPAGVLPYDAGGHDRIVLEEDNVLTSNRLGQELSLVGQRVHGIQVVAHDPRQIHVCDRWDEVRREDRGPAA